MAYLCKKFSVQNIGRKSLTEKLRGVLGTSRSVENAHRGANFLKRKPGRCTPHCGRQGCTASAYGPRWIADVPQLLAEHKHTLQSTTRVCVEVHLQAFSYLPGGKLVLRGAFPLQALPCPPPPRGSVLSVGRFLVLASQFKMDHIRSSSRMPAFAPIIFTIISRCRI